MYFPFYRISSCLFFGNVTDCFNCRRRNLLLLLKKPENPSNPHFPICHWFNSGVIFVILYSFLMLILCDLLFFPITTVHRCFLSHKKNLPGYRPFCLFLWYAPRHMHAQHFCLGCDQKKITPYLNFFRNLNFKNIVNFFKRTCCFFIIVM